MLLSRNRNYRLLFCATAVSNLGDGISSLALPWLATLLTRDPMLIAAVAAAGKLPWLLFTAPAGVITDRQDRQKLMVWSDLVRMALTCAIIGLIFRVPALDPAAAHAAYVWVLAALAFGLGMAEVLRDNAAQTALPSVVDKTELEDANGQLWSVEQITGSFIGPPLAGVLIALAVPLPFAFDALSFGVAALLVSMIAFPIRSVTPAVQGFWAELREGAQWLRAHRTILQLAVLLGCINALGGGYMTLYVLVSQEILGLSPFGHGLLMMAPAAGGVLGGVIGPKLVSRFGAQAIFVGAQAMFLAEPLGFVLGHTPFVIGLGMFATMFAAVSYNVVTVSYRQRQIPDALLGRVNALFRLFGWGMIPIGMMMAGAAVSWIEPVWGREAALRLPFGYAIAGYGTLMFYSLLAIRLR